MSAFGLTVLILAAIAVRLAYVHRDAFNDDGKRRLGARFAAVVHLSILRAYQSWRDR